MKEWPDMVCEAHPWLEWPHDDCAGPGMPPSNWQDFRKKPVVIQAIRMNVEVEIPTLEGTMRCDSGDWIICGVKGEFYPCKPDIFEATYEEVT